MGDEGLSALDAAAGPGSRDMGRSSLEGTVRKRYQVKRHSCPLCKPHRVGWEKRHTDRNLQRLKLDEREIRENSR